MDVERRIKIQIEERERAIPRGREKERDTEKGRQKVRCRDKYKVLG